MSQFTTFGTTQRVEMLPGVSRQMLSCGERAMVVRIELKQGSEVPLHSHPHEQIGFVQSGRMRFRIGDEEKVLGPNDGYFVPGGVTHGVWAEEDTVAIDIFSPVREEYRA